MEPLSRKVTRVTNPPANRLRPVEPQAPLSPPKASGAVAKPLGMAGPLMRLPWWQRYWRLLAGLIALVALTGVPAWTLAHASHPAAVVAHKVIKKVAVKPPTSYSPLTGLPVATAAAAQQPVIGVMIENLYPDARPQSGLGQAGAVYEALAEGGITRFLAIFQEPLPPSLGPVRSLRPYYLDWGLEYGIPVAHAGGSQPALAQVPTSGLKDINALIYDGSYFSRTSDRAAPHNLYTTADQLTALDAKLGFATAPTFVPQTRKADKVVSPAPHPTIRVTFSSSPYGVEYDFNPTTDSYNRFMGGAPHIDRNTNQQISVKNVVVEYVPATYGTQDDGKPETNMNLIGSGQALVFDDGTVTAGTWNKASAAAPTQLLSTGGQPIPLNRGNTWYEILVTGNSVTY